MPKHKHKSRYQREARQWLRWFGRNMTPEQKAMFKDRTVENTLAAWHAMHNGRYNTPSKS